MFYFLWLYPTVYILDLHTKVRMHTELCGVQYFHVYCADNKILLLQVHNVLIVGSLLLLYHARLVFSSHYLINNLERFFTLVLDGSSAININSPLQLFKNIPKCWSMFIFMPGAGRLCDGSVNGSPIAYRHRIQLILRSSCVYLLTSTLHQKSVNYSPITALYMEKALVPCCYFLQ